MQKNCLPKQSVNKRKSRRYWLNDLVFRFVRIVGLLKLWFIQRRMDFCIVGIADRLLALVFINRSVFELN